MPGQHMTVHISIDDVTPALALLEGTSGIPHQPLMTTLELTAERPATTRKFFGSRAPKAIEFYVREPLEPGGAKGEASS